MFIKAIYKSKSVTWNVARVEWELCKVKTWNEFQRKLDKPTRNPFEVYYPDLDCKDLEVEFWFGKLTFSIYSGINEYDNHNSEYAIVPIEAGVYIMSDEGKTVDRLN